MSNEPTDISASEKRLSTPSGLSSLPSRDRVSAALAPLVLLGSAVFIGLMWWKDRVPYQWAIPGMIMCCQPIDLIGRLASTAAKRLPLGKS